MMNVKVRIKEVMMVKVMKMKEWREYGMNEEYEEEEGKSGR